MTRILDARRPNVAYGYAAFLLFGALVKLNTDYLLTSNLGDYLWRVFWVLATAFWTFRLRCTRSTSYRQRDSPSTLVVSSGVTHRDHGRCLSLHADSGR